MHMTSSNKQYVKKTIYGGLLSLEGRKYIMWFILSDPQGRTVERRGLHSLYSFFKNKTSFNYNYVIGGSSIRIPPA